MQKKNGEMKELGICLKYFCGSHYGTLWALRQLVYMMNIGIMTGYDMERCALYILVHVGIGI